MSGALEQLVRTNLNEGSGLYVLVLRRSYVYNLRMGTVIQNPASSDINDRTTIFGLFKREIKDESFYVEPSAYIRHLKDRSPTFIRETRKIKVEIPYFAVLMGYKKGDLQDELMPNAAKRKSPTKPHLKR